MDMKPIGSSGPKGPEKQLPVRPAVAPLQPIVSKALSFQAAEKPSMGVQLTAADDSLLDCMENILNKPNPEEILQDFFGARTPSDFSLQGLLDAKYMIANLLTSDAAIAIACLKIIDGIKETLSKGAEATAIKANGLVISNSERKPSVIPHSQNPASKLTPEDIVLIKAVQTGTNDSIESAAWQDNISAAGIKEALTAAQSSKRGDHIISFLIDRLNIMASPEDDWKSVSSGEEPGLKDPFPGSSDFQALKYASEDEKNDDEDYAMPPPKKSNDSSSVSLKPPMSRNDFDKLRDIEMGYSIKELGLTEASLIELLRKNPAFPIIALNLSNMEITNMKAILDVCPNIKRLAACNCHITDTLIQQIVEHPTSQNIELLALERNDITNLGVELLFSMPKLEIFSLENNPQITDGIQRRLANEIRARPR